VLAATGELGSLSGGEVWVIHVREREPSKFVSSSAESGVEAEETVSAAVEKLSSAGGQAHGRVAQTVYGYAARETVSLAQTTGNGEPRRRHHESSRIRTSSVGIAEKHDEPVFRPRTRLGGRVASDDARRNLLGGRLDGRTELGYEVADRDG
jgi:hypothetical protein